MHFPVSYSTLSLTALKEYTRKTYNLDDIKDMSYLLRGMNDTYLITTSDKKLIFRIYRADRRREYSEVAFEIELLNYLDEQGIPVSLPIADHRGQFIQVLNAPEGDRYG